MHGPNPFIPTSYAPGAHAAPSRLLACADPGPQSRIVLIGPDTLELGCALIRAGAADVSIVRSGDGPHDAKADIAIVPHADTARRIEAAIATARRTLSPLGTLVMGDVPEGLLGIVRAHLRLHGFARLRSWSVPDGLVVQAELPMSGGVRCA